MDFPFGFGQKSSLLLIFFFHGIVFSFLSLRKGIVFKTRSATWLGLLLFLAAMYITPYMLGYAGWYGSITTKEILFFVPFMQVLLIGPVVYFYTQSLLNSAFKLSKKDWVHFIPVLLYSIYSLLVFVVDKLILEEYYFYADDRDKDLATWYQIAGLLSMNFYLVLSLRYYSNYKKLLFDTVSYADAILFRWIKNFMLAFLCILILRVLFFILNPDWGQFGSQFWHFIAFSLVFYYISINGYVNAVKSTTLLHAAGNDMNIFKEAAMPRPETNSGLLEADLKQWKERLEALMREKRVFENPRLAVSDVAQALGTNNKMISVVVNTGFQMNFNDFINHHRIEAVKELLHRGEHTTRTLLGIAFDCGFNSKATFNRAFKKSSSMSPKDYISKLP